MGFLDNLEKRISKNSRTVTLLGFLGSIPLIHFFIKANNKINENTEEIERHTDRIQREIEMVEEDNAELERQLVQEGLRSRILQARVDQKMDSLRKKDEKLRKEIDEVIRENNLKAEELDDLGMTERARDMRGFARRLEEKQQKREELGLGKRRQ